MTVLKIKCWLSASASRSSLVASSPPGGGGPGAAALAGLAGPDGRGGPGSVALAGLAGPDVRGGPPGAPGGWRNRRSQKLDKMEILTLQSSLHSEIQAKQAVGEELSRTRAELLASQR